MTPEEVIKMENYIAEQNSKYGRVTLEKIRQFLKENVDNIVLDEDDISQGTMVILYNKKKKKAFKERKLLEFIVQV